MKTVTSLEQLIKQLIDASANPLADEVRRAADLTAAAHGDHLRTSGETYLQHNVEVASLAWSLLGNREILISALLHDSLHPHSTIDKEQIEADFGAEVASLVAGRYKLAPYAEHHGRQSTFGSVESIRRAIMTIIDGDVRVIILHLADSLTDLRRASELSEEMRQTLARDARDIHAPLANRLGIWHWKWELEDLAFRFLEPDEYRAIADLIAERRPDRARHIAESASSLQTLIEENGLAAEVTGRPKHIYSIYRKMQTKGLDFEHIYDVRALRVIVESDEIAGCYQVLGIVHNLWQPIPHEFDDYIARAKANGYQSLHTSVIDEGGQTLEVQIRTRNMHIEAEMGVAAHWAYKEGGRGQGALNEQIGWLRGLLESTGDSSESLGTGDQLKTELFAERIYVFTPGGDVIDLPTGSTPIDFAYAIHSEVGNRCRGARVDGRMVGLDHRLESGQKVEIITSKRGGPSRDWMNEKLGYAASARTRSKIRSWFRQLDREQNIQHGRDIVTRELKRLGAADSYTVDDIARAQKFEDTELFLAKVGFGDIQATQVAGVIAGSEQKLRPADELRKLITARPGSGTLSVKGLSGLYSNMARCCTPLPPEPIVGYITRGRGITVHRQDCRQLLSNTERERWMEISWGGDDKTYPVPIEIEAYRRPGLMDDVARVLKNLDVVLLSTKTKTFGNLTRLSMLVEVATVNQLDTMLSNLTQIKNVLEARRQKPTP